MCLYFCSIPCNCDEILPSKYWSFEWILCMGVHSQGGRQLPPGKLAMSLVICFRNSDASIACLWTVWLSLDAQCAHSVHEHCNDNTVLQVCDSCQFLRYAVIISLHIVLLWMQQISFLAVTDKDHTNDTICSSVRRLFSSYTIEDQVTSMIHLSLLESAEIHWFQRLHLK